MHKILVADDEEISLSILEGELIEEGYDVYTASDGKIASELIEKHDFDLAILDVVMPYKDGFELTVDLKKNSSNTSIILITAHSSIESAVDAIKMGANDYLDKPYNIDLLLAKTRQLLNLKESKNSQPKFISGESQSVKKLERTISKVINLNTTILITGESGTGKGVVAKEIHALGNRKNKPFVHLDCASLTNSLIESELFGYEKGAFTGAEERQEGKFELSEDGIVFLDEIGTLSLELQTKLLTVLQDKSFYRIGGKERIPMDARVIAATNENLEDMVYEKKFREDLFYRLNVIQIEVPPLRERREDIKNLAQNFIMDFSNDMEKGITEIENEFFEDLYQYDWPGNIRELENAMESTVALNSSQLIQSSDLPSRILSQIKKEPVFEESSNVMQKSVENQEVQIIIESLEKFDGHREKTAKYLGISRRSLQYKLKKYDLLEE